MTKELIGYKVITKSRRSAISANLYSGLHYPINKEVTPKMGCGPICVFQTIHQARAFKDGRVFTTKGLRLVKCKYIKSSKVHIWDRYSLKMYEIMLLPRGTILADSVTCLE